MSYLALYRKYRPSSFSDLVGQPEIANIIKNEILNNRISHAYLFSGPRGTGKTSTAKIIAKMINCSNLSDDGVPCGKCDSCINFSSSGDIVEIDAASNNGVDEIRELRDKVNLVPSFGRYKVYIIDEVHMLTTQAFNALLKTLEEPPSHIVFILATTELHKIPVTVVSRCQKFQFLKFSNEDIVSRLEYISKNENILVNHDILNEIARLSDGGMRDAINLLDQLSSFSNGNLNIEDLYRLSGVVSYKDFSDILIAIRNGDFKFIIQFVDSLDHSGKSLDRFIGEFVNFIKDLLIVKNKIDYYSFSVEKYDLLNDISSMYDFDVLYDLIFSFNELSVKLKNSSFAKILLITEFIRFCNKFSTDNHLGKITSNINDKFSVNNDITNKDLDRNDIVNKNVTDITDKEKMIRINNAFATASKEYKESFMAQWNNVLDRISSDSSYVSIALMINDIEVMVVGKNNIIFVAGYDSLLERLFEQIDVIERLLFDVYHCEYKVIFLLNDEWNFEKNKYISSIKSGKKYVYIENLDDNDKMVDDDVKKIVSILGNDVIAYE